MLIGGMVLVANLLAVQGAEAKKVALRSVPESFSALSEMASPAVVNISTERTIKGGGRVYRHFFRGPRGPSEENDPMRDLFDRFFGGGRQREFKQRSLGSGFVVDKAGHIVTNNHVIEDADEIKVILSDEEEYDAEIVGRDPNTDIALIKIKSGEDLPVVQLGDSDALKVGQWVVAIGNPFGLDHTVTAGIVSAKGRVIGITRYDDLIQTDASINPGNSGGPLLNMKGEVVGINTAIVASGTGIGFAIPINLASGVIDQLRDKGEVTRGWLGVEIQDLTEELADYYGRETRKGVLVTNAIDGDPADQAGIRPKDIITEIDGTKIDSSKTLLSLIAGTGVDEVVKVKVYRDGDEKTFRVKIGRRDEEKLLARSSRDRGDDDGLGIRVSEITPDMANRYNIAETEGVIVTAVRSGGKGVEGGIRVGDIIKEVNRRPVRNHQDYYSAIGDVDRGDPILMYVRRASGRYVIIRLEK